MNDGLGRVVKEWIVFAVGVVIGIALLVNFLVTGRAADLGLLGLAGACFGFGSIILQKNGNGR